MLCHPLKPLLSVILCRVINQLNYDKFFKTDKCKGAAVQRESGESCLSAGWSLSYTDCVCGTVWQITLFMWNQNLQRERQRDGTMGHRTSVGIWLQGGTFSLGNDGDYESARIFLGACHYVVKRSYKVKKRW